MTYSEAEGVTEAIAAYAGNRPLTWGEVDRAVEAIEVYAQHQLLEYARPAEDRLYAAVLQAIARGQCDDPVALAAAALQSRRFDLKRT